MNKFIKDIKISHAMIAMAVSVVSLIIAGSYYSLSHLKTSRDFVTSLKKDRIEPVYMLNTIIEDYSVNIVDAANKANNNVIKWDEAAQNIQTTRKNIENVWNQFYAKIKNEDIRNKSLIINNLMQKASFVLDSLNIYLNNNDVAAVDKLVETKLYPAIDPITEAIREIINTQQKEVLQITSESDELYNKSYNETGYLSVAAILIVILLSLFIIRIISNSLKKANESIKRISEGDLTVEIEGYGNDEIGELLHNIKGLLNNLRPIMENIHSAASNIVITSNELSNSSQVISQGATEQAASVEEIAASMEEISSNIIQNTKNSNVTEQISTQAGIEFESGRENIDITVEAIKTIASKTSIIGEIAFQTNILALNAAVEAARAGEHGKGFGVVAAEVGKLAERIKIAAAEIDALSVSGVDLSLKSKELLKIALPNINKMIKLVNEISLASSEQSSGVDQINSGIQTLNQVTQQNAAASEQMATVAEEMAAQAEQLSNSISFFKTENVNTQKRQKAPTQKYIEQKSYLKFNKTEKQKGIELNMDTQDDLDNEFETF